MDARTLRSYSSIWSNGSSDAALFILPRFLCISSSFVIVSFKRLIKLPSARLAENAFSTPLTEKLSTPVANVISFIFASPLCGGAVARPVCYSSAVNVTTPAVTEAVPVVRVPPYVTSMGIPTKPPPSPPRLEGFTIAPS